MWDAFPMKASLALIITLGLEISLAPQDLIAATRARVAALGTPARH